MRGASGELRRGYQVAAQLGPWTMDETGQVQVDRTEVDSYWMDQAGPALQLWLRVGQRAWVWRTVEVLDGETCRVLKAGGSPSVRDA